MFTRIALRHFKSFRAVSIPLAPFTVLVGTNAAGKSNLRDAFRFAHGIGRGYSLPEVLGGRWNDAAVREWSGLRGGAADVATHGEHTLEVSLTIAGEGSPGDYALACAIDPETLQPRITREALASIFETRDAQVSFSAPEYFGASDPASDDRDAQLASLTARANDWYSPIRPLLARLEHRGAIGARVAILTTLAALQGIRFLDPTPAVMREPSPPGVRVLGDHGENLASVLEGICETAAGYDTLVGWLRQLTPTDVADIRFERVYGGRTVFELIEAGGSVTSMDSASDGTLRFLALLAALLNPAAHASCLVIEEVDTGIHPTRLHLLVELLTQHCREGRGQVIATTHAPALLTLLDEDVRDAALLVYRSNDGESCVRRIMEMPGARDVIHRHDLGRLHAAGWLEDVASFADVPDEPFSMAQSSP